MAKMNPEIKARWVAALRSGKYKQGTGALRTSDDRFCCLGVLCNLHAQAHPDIASREHDPESYMGEDGLPPKEVYRWAWLGINDKLTIDGKSALPDVHNDGKAGCKKSTFAEIADAIEEQL